MKPILLMIAILVVLLSSCNSGEQVKQTPAKAYKAKSLETGTVTQIWTRDSISYYSEDTVWVNHNQMITPIDSNTAKYVIVQGELRPPAPRLAKDY